MTTLIISRSIPPRSTGSAIIIENLVKNLSEGEIVLLGSTNSLKDAKRQVLDNVHVTYLPDKLKTLSRGQRFVNWTRWLLLPIVVIVGCWLIFSEQCNNVVVVVIDEFWIIASMLISVFSRRSLIPYIHDPLSDADKPSWGRARYLEKLLFRQASKVMVLYDWLADRYRDEYGIECIVVKHISNQRMEPRNPTKKVPPYRVGFSGWIYENNKDLLQALCSVIGHREEFEIYLYTPVQEKKLIRMGIWSSNLHQVYVSSSEELVQELANCDVVYLPLSFQPVGLSRDSLKWVFPTKSIEYLQSGTPILVHCPKDYQTSQFFFKQKCGVILNDPEEENLLEAIEAICRDSGLVDELRPSNAFCLERI